MFFQYPYPTFWWILTPFVMTANMKSSFREMYAFRGRTEDFMTHQKYAYVRVSTKHQKASRQIKALMKLGISRNNIIVEKSSGKDFKRSKYQQLLKLLKAGDVLYISSIDRLGRDYDGIISEWHQLTKKLNIIIKVIDNPILDTDTAPATLIDKYLKDITLLTLAFQSEQEWQNIKERQKAGITIAKEKGTVLGRPKSIRSDNEIYIIKAWQDGIINLHEAMQKLGLKKSAFYKLAGEIKK